MGGQVKDISGNPAGNSHEPEDSERTNPGETPGEETEEEYRKKLAFFLGQLEDPSEGVRWKAAESLGRLGDPAAVEALIDTLWDDDNRVRMKAAWALGMIGDPRALPGLRTLYRIENENVREIIERAMNDIRRQMGG